MRILISNYSSNSQTECYYLSSAINLIKGCSSIIWDNKEHSAYDIFDTFQPDYFLTHISTIYTDALRYMSENKNIKLIVNSTGATKEVIKKVEQMLIDENVQISFFYTNNDEEVTNLKKHNMISVPFGADVFLNNKSDTRYSIDTAFFVNDEVNIPHTKPETYHSISVDKSLQGKADIVLPIFEISSIYTNYNNIVFRYFGNFIPQLFFDTVFYGKKVQYQLDNLDQQMAVESKIKKILKLESCEDFESMKNAVRNKHTCLHRAKTILSQLPSHEFISQIDSLIQVYTGENK